MPATIFNVVYCPNPSRPVWEALVEADYPHKALYAWAPDAWKRRNPPESVRAALWGGLASAGGTVGFTAERVLAGPGSVWRETRQGWIARRFRPMPGLIWTGDPETFDAAFDAPWAAGTQVIFALGPDCPIPRLPAEALQDWTGGGAAKLPKVPTGTQLVVRAGADGELFAVFGRNRKALDAFVDGFRAGLPWRDTTFQRAREEQLGQTLSRLSASQAEEPPLKRRWFEGIERIEG